MSPLGESDLLYLNSPRVRQNEQEPAIASHSRYVAEIAVVRKFAGCLQAGIFVRRGAPIA